ncbi:MAG: S53 family peptidase [Bryobacteraceae bacterium]
MPKENRIDIAGSERKPLPGARTIGPVPANEIVHATVVLRRRGDNPAISQDPRSYTPHIREDYGVVHGADPNDLQAVEDFAHQHGLTVSERDPARRSIVVTGTAEAIQSAFGTALHMSESNGFSYRSRTGSLSIPDSVHPAVMAVLGLDNRPVAKPHFRVRKGPGPATKPAAKPHAGEKATPAIPAGAFSPVQLAHLYNFPTNTTGAGQTIAIIELGGGYRIDDLRTYFSGLGIPLPMISAVAVDSGLNKPGSDADGEVMLDIEVAGAIAPGARIVVYFAPNTDQGFHDAISKAAHDMIRKPSIMSISWGNAEDAWTSQALQAMNAALQDAAAMGVTVTVASGDNGSSDDVKDGKQHVDFPAASPFVLACGGTKLQASGSQISSEEVWNETAAGEGATGGGVSNLSPLPDYQKSAGIPPNVDTGFVGRGVPDISGDADPTTGYFVRVNGQDMVIGGTSAVAPLWAGLAALINQQLGHSLGFVNPRLYSIPASCFRDITAGNNGAYSAGPHWDACTGLGSPNGVALSNAFLGVLAAKQVS